MAQEPRDRWISRTAFIMAAVGSAVGLGNLWRFPTTAYQNGGGAFFIPYFVALISAGIPLMIVEYALGQKFQGGAPKALAAVTEKFRWVGWFALLVATTITFYYVAIMAYAWHYAAASWSVAWTDPAPMHEVETEDGVPAVKEFPAENVRLYIPARDEEQREREEAAQERKAPEDRVPVLTPAQVEQLKRQPENRDVRFVSLTQNVEHYFREVVLGKFRPGYWGQAAAAARGGQAERAPPYTRDMFGLTPGLVIGALITWLAIFFIIFKGVHNVGKVVMITVPLPVILLLIVLLRGVTLPGSGEGLLYYLKPNWAMLKDPSVWIAAYGQIFFSLSLGFGILIAYASYMPPESDVTNSAFITSFGNCATSFLAGLAVFSVLGYLAYVQGQNVEDVVAGGPGLVFVTYPIALAKMPMAGWAIGVLSFLFFACLITLGIDSAFSLIEGCVTGVRDRFPWISRPVMTATLCIIGFCGSLFFCTRSGLMWLDIVDRWMSNYGLVMVGLLECIAVGYFAHLDELKGYINKHSEIKVHNWFDAFVKVITPAILIFLLTNQFLTDITEVYGGYDAILEHSVTLAGWGWFAFIICVALLLSRHYKMVAAIGGTGVLFLLILVWFRATTGQPAGAVVAPAAMAAVAAALLFGGLTACIWVAVKTHHMAGLSLEEMEEAEETDSEVTR
ncbi:MAG: hypothetical protein R6X33_01495 [Candidatus Brocadiia bacterium]